MLRDEDDVCGMGNWRMSSGQTGRGTTGPLDMDKRGESGKVQGRMRGARASGPSLHQLPLDQPETDHLPDVTAVTGL